MIADCVVILAMYLIAKILFSFGNRASSLKAILLTYLLLTTYLPRRNLAKYLPTYII